MENGGNKKTAAPVRSEGLCHLSRSRTKFAKGLKAKKTWNREWREGMITIYYGLVTTDKSRARAGMHIYFLPYCVVWHIC